MEHRIILKCRICLDEFDEEKMFDIFGENAETHKIGDTEYNDSGTPRKLVDKVEFCCGVRIRQSKEMPTKMCIKCFDMTRMWFNFRQMCLNSQVYLESLCKDRIKPPGMKGKNDADYLEYLFEQLQTYRFGLRSNLSGAIADTVEEEDTLVDVDDNVLENEEEEDGTSAFIETVESDPEFEQTIIKKEEPDAIKKEPRDTVDTDHLHQKYSQTKNKSKRSSKYNTGRKMKYRPPSPSSYMCSICGNVYTKKASFTYHMSLHSDVKPHECELCGKAFRQVCELKNHMRRHTGEKPYKCTYCDRHFTDRSEKHRHERVHTNTRPYTCKVCGKSFMYSAILKNHVKMHSEEKEFNCLVCQKAFTLQHQLKAHLQTLTHKQKETQFVNAGYEVVYE